MSSRVRLLPAVIGAAGVLMMLRLGAMASSANETPAPEAPVMEGQTDAATVESPTAPAADAPATAATTEPTPIAPVSEQKSATTIQQAQTKGEAEVLQNLSERRAALEARERDVAMHEQLISATEKRVEERLVELKDLEGKLNAMLAKRDEEEEAQVASLVKTYENMKPADAAKIFNKLDRTIMLTVASRMKPAKIGALMAAMEPQRAQELTVLLATRMKVAKAHPIAAPAPASPPAASPPAEATPPVAPAQPAAAAPAAPQM